MSFNVKTYGKWILAGEHSVLRGHPALVFPIQTKFMEWTYSADAEPLRAEFTGSYGSELRILFWGLLENALEKIKVPRSDIKGFLQINNQLPLGGGLGASAAFCVGLTRWMSHLGYVDKDKLYDFARSLEDIFHGESSGVDIAASLAGQGISFLRGGQYQPISVQWHPCWYLSYSGRRGVTSECVAKVKRMLSSDPATGQAIDEQMHRAVDCARESLGVDAERGFPILKESIDIAESCFRKWGLISPQLEEHMALLRGAGAVAVKPTGSGDGGYVLSLWQSKPENPGISFIEL